MRRKFPWPRAHVAILLCSAGLTACATGNPSATASAIVNGAPLGAGRVDSSAPMVPLRGRLIDSLTSNDMLRGALVSIDGSEELAGTNDEGVFQFDRVRPGQRRLIIRHPQLDSLGLDTISVPFRFTENDDSVTISIPSARTYFAARCGRTRSKATDGVISGVARYASSDKPMVGTTIVAAWRGLDTTYAGDGLRERARVQTSASGQFLLCRVPRFTPVEIWAVAASPGTSRQRVQLGEATFGSFDISVDTSRTPIIARTTPVATGTIRGRIVTQSGDGLPNVTVELDQPSMEAVTDGQGSFTFWSVPAGTRTLDIRAIGFRPSRVGISIRPDQQVERDITLNRSAAVLGMVTVRASLPATWDSVGFEERQKRGSGYFISQEMMKGVVDLGTVLRMAPGIRGKSNERTQRLVAGRGLGCYPAFIVNGTRFDPGGTGGPEAMINPDAVRAIEVYNSRLSTPPQYQIYGDCAVIVIWLRSPQREREAAARARLDARK